MINARWYGWSAPLLRPLRFGHSEVGERRGRLLCVSDGEHVGWGEVSPLPGFGMATLDEIDDALEDVGASLRDAVTALRSLDDLAAIGVIADGVPAPAGMRAAIVGALADLAARRAGVPLWRWLGGTRGTVLANALAGSLDADAVERVRPLVAAGYDVVKLKAPDAASSPEHVAALHAAYPGTRWRLDANGAWHRNEARAALAALVELRVEYVEQPVAADDIDGLLELARLGVGVAADEALVDAASADALLAHRALACVVLKPATLGGLDIAAGIARRALAVGVGVTVTTFIDSAVGRAHAAHLAAALAPDDAHGLGTGAWLRRDVGAVAIDARPRAELGDAVGLGLEPAPGAIEALT